MDKLELKNIAVEQGLDFDGVIELVFETQQLKIIQLEERLAELLKQREDVLEYIGDDFNDFYTGVLIESIHEIFQDSV